MFDRQDDVVERMIRELRRPVGIDPAFDDRVMQAIERQPEPLAVRSPYRLVAWLAAAAVLATLVIARPRDSHSTPSDTFQFVLVAPRAASVSLVGDFNDWNPARTPLRAATDGVWSTVLPLAPGRYRYAFLVNGVEWQADPAAPAALDDEFGTPSSVVTVAGKGS